MEKLLFAFKDHINWLALLFSILCVRLDPGAFATELICFKLQSHGTCHAAAAMSDIQNDKIKDAHKWHKHQDRILLSVEER